jgi:hypothetical protein
MAVTSAAWVALDRKRAMTSRSPPLPGVPFGTGVEWQRAGERVVVFMDREDR